MSEKVALLPISLGTIEFLVGSTWYKIIMHLKSKNTCHQIKNAIGITLDTKLY